MTDEFDLETITEIEKMKAAKARKDFSKLIRDHQKILKVLQVQLTNTLVNITENEKELRSEVGEYWMKELALRPVLVSYIKNVGNLINIYTQIEQTQNTAMNEVYENLDFPDYEDINNKYNELLQDMREKLTSMKIQMKKYEKDLKEDFENQKEKLKEEFDDKVLEERNKLHKEYEDAIEEAEEVIEKQKKTIKSLEKKVKK